MNKASRLRMELIVFLTLLFAVFPALGHDDDWNYEHDEWSFAGEYDDTVYLVDHDELRIDRYDMKQSVWLDPLIPPAQPTAFTVDQHGVVIAADRTLYTVATGTTEFVFFSDSVGSVHSLASDGGSTLYISMDGSPNHTSRNRTTGVLIENRNFGSRVISTAYSLLYNVLLGRSSGYTPSDIIATDLSEPQDYRAQRDSPYHGDFPYADQLWLFPDNNRVLDSAGTIYSVPDLNWVGNTASQVHGSVFNTDATYILSDGAVSKLNDRYLEIGRIAVHEDTEALFGSNQTLFSFGMIDGTPSVDSFSTASVVMPAANTINPASLSFTADEVVTAQDGAILVLSRDNNALLSYSPDFQEFTQGYSLRGAPEIIAPAIDSNSLFLGYDNGSITRLDLHTGLEHAFLNLSGRITALVPFEDKLFASDPFGLEGSFYIADLNGNVIDSIEWRESAANQVWLSATRELVGIRNGNLTAQLILDNSTFGGDLGPRTFNFLTSNSNFNFMVLSPDESLILTAGGDIFDANTRELNDSLHSRLVEAVWASDGYIVSLDDSSNDPYYNPSPLILNANGNYVPIGNLPPETTDFDLGVWGSNYAPIREVNFAALNAKLVQSGSRVYLVVDEEDRNQPRFIEVIEGSDDLDGDTIVDSLDAFPIDPLRSAPDDNVTDSAATDELNASTEGSTPGLPPQNISIIAGPDDSDIDLIQEPAQTIQPNFSGTVDLDQNGTVEIVGLNEPAEEIETDGSIVGPDITTPIETDTDTDTDVDNSAASPEVAAVIETDDSIAPPKVTAAIETDDSVVSPEDAIESTKASVGSFGFLTCLFLGLSISGRRRLETS